MPSLRSIGFVCAVAIQAAACSSSTLIATRDAASSHDAAAADARSSHDAAAGTDATRDAARLDAGPTCSAPVTDQCTTDAGDPCRRTWDEVLATPLRCDRSMGPGDVSVQESRQTCGAYNVVLFEHLDWVRLYYYDMTTGKLMAVYFSGNAQPASCVAGPAAGIAPCQLSGAPPCRPDASTDART